MIAKFNYILFDVDGVLVDSVGYYTKIIRSVAETLGADPNYDDLFYRKRLGVSFDNWMSDIVPSENHHKMETLFDERNQDGSNSTLFELFVGIEELLKSIQSEGKKIGLISTKSRKGMDLFLYSNHLNEYIDFSIAGDEVTNYKPNPEGINKAIEYLGAKRSEVIFIGDSLHDHGAAKNAGISFIGVTTGVCSEEDWEKENANYINSVCELKENSFK